MINWSLTCWWKFHGAFGEFVYLETRGVVFAKKQNRFPIAFCPWEVWKYEENFSSSFQAISNKHNCCNSNNNNCIKICDNQIVQAVQEKEKEGLVDEDEESYNKFRQLLSYDDVSLSHCKMKYFIQLFLLLGSKLSSVQSLHSQRIPHNAAYKALLGVHILVDKWNSE